MNTRLRAKPLWIAGAATLLFGVLCIVAIVTMDLAIGLGVVNFGPETDGLAARVEQIRSRVPDGTSRDDALTTLDDAWARADCRYSDGSGQELFFYGSKNLELSEVVVVDYEIVADDRVVVYRVSGIENDVLHFYADCLKAMVQTP